MNRAAHYAAAERLLADAENRCSANWPAETGEDKADILAAAQVHATLASAPRVVADTAQAHELAAAEEL